ncbi:MAG TPA: hypothetical protein EYP22_00120 [Methanosarcinales archaeon]|nr:hypothetical protein [Methanosarcinales archaeon]
MVKRIEVSNIKGFFKKDIVVEIGTEALFLRYGKLTGTLAPGSYTVGGALKSLECISMNGVKCKEISTLK